MRGTVLAWALGRCGGGLDAVSGRRPRVAWCHRDHGSGGREQHKSQDQRKFQTATYQATGVHRIGWLGYSTVMHDRPRMSKKELKTAIP